MIHESILYSKESILFPPTPRPKQEKNDSWFLGVRIDPALFHPLTGIGNVEPDARCLPLWNHFPKSRTMCMNTELSRLAVATTRSGNSYLWYVVEKINVRLIHASVCKWMPITATSTPVYFSGVPPAYVESDDLGGAPLHGGREHGRGPRVRHP